jgi:hypothetical protein
MQVASVKSEESEESEENVEDEVDVEDEEGEVVVVGPVVNSQMVMLRSRLPIGRSRVLVEHMYCI